MRHVRMLMVVVAALALALVGAAPAMAKETPKETSRIPSVRELPIQRNRGRTPTQRLHLGPVKLQRKVVEPGTERTV